MNTKLPAHFPDALKTVMRQPGGICVAAAILSAMGGPGYGTAAVLRRHGVEPTGDTKADIKAHRAWHFGTDQNTKDALAPRETGR